MEMLNVCHNFEEKRGRKVEVRVSIVTQLVHTLPQPGQFKLTVIMVIMIIFF